MAKKKQGGELKSTPVPLQVQKYRDLASIREGSHFWNATHIQPFFPPIETLFKTDELENVHEYGLKLHDQVTSITSKDTIRTASGSKNVHIKPTMILSPLKWLRGDYSTSLGLSTSKEQSARINTKLQSPHNAAYVGSLFAAAFSQTECVHFPKVYGVFSGISNEHTINISDDYEDLMDKPWFSQNIGQTFELKLTDEVGSSKFQHTRCARPEMEIGADITLEGVEEMEGIPSDQVDVPEMNAVFGSEDDVDDLASDSSSVSTSYVFNIRSCDCSEMGDDEEDGSEDEGFAWATFKNVPVQYTIMEKCEGTLYKLFKDNTDTTKQFAWMSQVIFALLFAQKTFGFVHNDLHSNNVMYVATELENLYYKVGEKTYKVPTYGYIIKLIDFERGTGSIRVVGMKEPKTFISDHFAINEEAGGQYNIDPFYLSKFPGIKPNPSFDLVRLATSLFWDLFPEGPNHEEYKEIPMFQGLMKWLSVDDKNILFSSGNPKHERYHGFHLYKAIARFSKDAVPRREIELLPFTTNFVSFYDTCLCISE